MRTLDTFDFDAQAALIDPRQVRELATGRGDALPLLGPPGVGKTHLAIALGRDALSKVGSTPDVWRLIYPVAARDTIVAEARRAGLDPALVAGLIRQESNFNPGAISPAGARGLMQVMPAVGKSIAPAAGITSWNPSLLYDPGINIEIGVRHLAPLLKSQPNIARSLAAYNAGGSRVARWSTKRGADDLCEAAKARTRTPAGHPEGYLEAFANLYRGFAEAIWARREGRTPSAIGQNVPTVFDGLKGVAFVDAVVDSAETDERRWLKPHAV